MSSFFGDRLLKARESAGLSGYKIVQLTGIAQGNLQAIEKGRRSPSDANLEALAAVDELGVSLDELKAWRDLDRIGIEGIERIKKFAPEVLAGGAEPEPPRPKRKTTSDTIAQVVAQLPPDMKHPPTQKELEILDRIGGFDMSEIDPRSQSYIWSMPPGQRLRSLRQAERDWTEANDDAGVAGDEA